MKQISDFVPKTLSSILEKIEEDMERDRMCYRASSKGSLRYDVFAAWEERAFAEDSAGDLGSIWPPRSYSCSFCDRDFRSAQALGGHMNVHRRDRARLKQSQSRQSDEEAQIAIDHLCKDRRLPSSPISSHLDLDRGTLPKVSSCSLISDKRSAVLGDRMLASSPNWSPLGRKHEKNKGTSSLVSRSSVYPTIVKAMNNISDTNHGKKLRCIGNSGKYSINETTSFKMARISDSRTLPRFTLDRFFTEDYLPKSEVSRVKVGPREELDLELRLGSPSEVKIESRV